MEKDNPLKKQILGLAKVITKILFKNEDYIYTLPSDKNYSENDNLYIKVMDLFKEKEYCKAEDTLFDALDGHNQDYVKIAIAFYTSLTDISDEELEKHNFSRSEIELGFLDVLRSYNIKIEKGE